MTTRIAQALFGIAVGLITGLTHADHALLTDGHVVYNVMLPDGASTGGMLVRIRTSTSSFEFDPRTNVVIPLPNHSVIRKVADYVKSSRIVGREEATAMFQQKAWSEYVEPVREQLVAPSPAPKMTPLPVHLAQATPIPLNVVPDSVPLQERLDRQLDMFMKEQSTMAQDAVTSVVQGILTPEKSLQLKVGLLERQKLILERYYPQTTETVKLAVNYWAQQVDRAKQSGRFDLENL